MFFNPLIRTSQIFACHPPLQFPKVNHLAATLMVFQSYYLHVWTLPTVAEFPTIPLHMVAADFDGEGKTDLVIGNCCGLATMSVLFGKGTGAFQAEQLMQVAGSPAQIAVADLNGDNRPDIVSSSGNVSGMLVTLINEYGIVSSSSDEP